MKKTSRALDEHKGYWDKRCEALSSFLWLPSEKVLDDMPESSVKLEGTEQLKDSWFSSQIYSLAGAGTSPKDDRQVVKTDALRSRKIRFYPDAEQRKILTLWIKALVFVYNKTLEYFAGGGSGEWVKVKRLMLMDLPEWLDDVPYQLKAIAARDACINVKLSAKSGSTARPRAESDAKHTIFVPKMSARNGGVYPRFLGRLNLAEKMPEPDGDCRLIYDCGRWFVSVPVNTTELSESAGRTAALDPGVRSFITFYGADSCGKIGEGAFSRIYSLCGYLDDLNARMAKTNHRQRYKMKKAADRLHWRIRNLVEELQHKTALFLVRNFDVIALPELRADFAAGFESESLRRVLRETHSDFRDFLESKAREYGRRIIAQDEQWTSQTCSWSGEIRKPGRKFIRDKGVTVDRDYNGARGIFLRALRESAILSPV